MAGFTAIICTLDLISECIIPLKIFKMCKWEGEGRDRALLPTY